MAAKSPPPEAPIVKDKINQLVDAINAIYNRDENLRKLIKLPSIDSDIRKLGVGGGKSTKND